MIIRNQKGYYVFLVWNIKCYNYLCTVYSYQQTTQHHWIKYFWLSIFHFNSNHYLWSNDRVLLRSRIILTNYTWLRWNVFEILTCDFFSVTDGWNTMCKCMHEIKFNILTVHRSFVVCTWDFQYCVFLSQLC